MSKWISEIQAIAVVRLRTSLPNADEVFADAVSRGEILTRGGEAIDQPSIEKGEIFRDTVNLYAGGMTYVDLEEDDDIRQLGNQLEIDFGSLQSWLDSLIGSVPNPSEKAPVSPKSAGGRPDIYEWDAYTERFGMVIGERGFPDKLNVRGWQLQADVERWLKDLVEKDTGNIIADKTARRRAKEMMDRYRQQWVSPGCNSLEPDISEA